MNDEWAAFFDAVRQARLVALATVVAGPGCGRHLLFWPDGHSTGTLGEAALDAAVAAHTVPLLRERRPARVELILEGVAYSIFVDVQPPPPKLIVVGAVHIAIPLVTFARTLGFYTVVVDARSAFATPARFGHADQLMVGWPTDVLPALNVDESTCFVILTHDEKIDDPALLYACRSSAHYIGALGARRTHARRVERLTALGLTAAEIGRIHAPIGLDIGARRPEEIALAIMAEIVAALNGRMTNDA